MGFHFNACGHHQVVRVAARGLGKLADALTADGKFLGGHAGRMPTVASASGSPQRPRAAAANPERYVRRTRYGLYRLGRKLEVFEFPAVATVSRVLVGPQLPHDVHGLVGQQPALAHGYAQGVEFRCHGAYADAQDDAATGHLIQRSRVFGQLHRVVIRQDQH